MRVFLNSLFEEGQNTAVYKKLEAGGFFRSMHAANQI
jgi:hypothetical protein